MADRKIYLCVISLSKDDPKGDPFFNCGHHFGQAKDSLDKRESGASIEKITDVDNEACEDCIGDSYSRQFNKARNRAKVILASLDPPHPTKDQVL